MSLTEYRNKLNSMERTVFDETVDMGILRTIAALYDAGVNDSEIIRVVTKQWELDEHSVIKKLVFIKGDASLNALTDHLLCLGFSEQKIAEFLVEHQVRSKIRTESELWKLKDKPEKLYEAVQSKKKRKGRG